MPSETGKLRRSEPAPHILRKILKFELWTLTNFNGTQVSFTHSFLSDRAGGAGLADPVEKAWEGG